MVNNVYDLVTRTMEQEFPGRVAFRWVEDATGTVKEKTYAEYAQDIRRAAAWFARNIPEVEGKRVVLLSRNCYEYGVNTFGAVLAGAVLVTMNQKKTWDELSWELELAEPALILNDGVDYGCRDQLEAAYGERLRPMDVWKDTAPGGLEKKIDPNALMVMLFTSGTTGRSKAVMLAERNFFTVMQMHVAMGDHLLDFKHRQLPEDKNDVLSNFAILPLFHLGTFICLFSWPFKGWALNLCSDLRNFYRDLGLMESIYKDVKRGRADKLNGLWNPCGSSAMFDSEMLLGLVENGMYITQCYGMTETCGDGLVNYAQAEPHIRALGKPDGHCEYKLDETGEICIRGGCVMLGYYKDPEATAEIIDKDGWLHTGDLAREDEDGYYYMVGRKKNLIILGTGENVSPEELERKLNACPEVQECVGLLVLLTFLSLLTGEGAMRSMDREVSLPARQAAACTLHSWNTACPARRPWRRQRPHSRSGSVPAPAGRSAPMSALLRFRRRAHRPSPEHTRRGGRSRHNGSGPRPALFSRFPRGAWSAPGRG